MSAVLQLNQFILWNGIRPADAIVAKKQTFKLVKHFIIYLGQDYWNRPVFMANMNKRGVIILEPEEIVEFTNTYEPTEIQPFEGTELEREEAVERALEVQNEWNYNYVLRNCEHFKNWVQNGLPESIQTRHVSLGLALGGAVIGASSENKALRTVAMLAAGAGLLAYLIEEFGEK